MRFVAVGELLVDVLAQGSGHEARIRLEPAGSAFNAAVAARAAGADTTVLGTVGDDPAGRLILTELEARGVRTEVTVANGPTGTFLLMGDEVRVDRGVAHDIALPEEIDADIVLVSGYIPAAAEALARARAEWVALDAANLAELPPGGNAVFSSAPQHILEELAEGRRLAVRTQGPLGAVAMLDGQIGRIAPRRIVDSGPGAGDAFAATLLVALARGDNLEAALSDASRAALDSLA